MRDLTTDQLLTKVIRDVEQMTPQEKAEVRRHLDGIFADGDREFLRAVGINSTILTDRLGIQLARELPPIPDGHYRLMASDGGLHDIPAENIDLARQIDPLLVILNPYDFWG